MTIIAKLDIQIIFSSKKIFEIHLGDFLNISWLQLNKSFLWPAEKKKKKDKIEDKNKSDSNNQNLAPF